jgi:hypothetical protein
MPNALPVEYFTPPLEILPALPEEIDESLTVN